MKHPTQQLFSLKAAHHLIFSYIMNHRKSIQILLDKSWQSHGGFEDRAPCHFEAKLVVR